MSVRPTVPARSTTAGRGFLLVVLAGLCWGTAGISGALVIRRSDLGPLDIAWHRLVIAAVALFLADRFSRRRRPAPRPLTRSVVLRLVLIGAGLAGYQFSYFTAVETAGVSIATLIALGLAPLLIAVGAALLGHGRPDRATVAALATALAGLVLLVGISTGEGGAAVLLGALIAVGSALAHTTVTLTGTTIPAGVPVTLAAFAGGALLLTPLALVLGLRFTAEPGTLALLFYLGLVPSALAYALFFTGLRTVPGAVAGIVTLLEPVTATVLATAFLGERLAPWALVGGLLVLAAVATLYLRRMTAVPPATEPPAPPMDR